LAGFQVATYGRFCVATEVHSNKFFTKVLPELLRLNVLERTKHQGSGFQEHYRLRFKMSEIAQLISASDGSYDKFLELVKSTVPTD
jgi:hypothetical protein